MTNVYMERYIYEVIRRIPKNKRDSCKSELETKISDMCKYDERNMMSVLDKLGDPAIYARKYTTNNKTFIGSEYLEQYITVLKIALSCTIVVAVVFALLEAMNSDFADSFIGTQFYVDFFETFFVLLFEYTLSSCFAIAVLITIIFAIIQHNKADRKIKKEWAPEQLPPIPNKKNSVSTNQCMIHIVVSLIIAGILIINPKLFGVYLYAGKEKVQYIPLFNQGYWDAIVIVTLCILLVAVVKNVIELVGRFYTKQVISTSIGLSVVQLILTVILLKVLPLFNPNFVKDVSTLKEGNISYNVESATQWYTDVLPIILLILVVVYYVIIVGKTVYKSKHVVES